MTAVLVISRSVHQTLPHSLIVVFVRSLLPLDVGCGAGENLDKVRFGIGVAFKTLADGFA